MYRIGIDLGGTNIAVGVVNDRYEIVARRSVPTGAERPAEEVIRDMGDAVEEALRQAGLTAADCASMGVGSPGACDPQTGVVKRAYNLNWFDVPVCRMLRWHRYRSVFSFHQCHNDNVPKYTIPDSQRH